MRRTQWTAWMMIGLLTVMFQSVSSLWADELQRIRVKYPSSSVLSRLLLVGLYPRPNDQFLAIFTSGDDTEVPHRGPSLVLAIFDANTASLSRVWSIRITDNMGGRVNFAETKLAAWIPIYYVDRAGNQQVDWLIVLRLNNVDYVFLRMTPLDGASSPTVKWIKLIRAFGRGAEEKAFAPLTVRMPDGKYHTFGIIAQVESAFHLFLFNSQGDLNHVRSWHTHDPAWLYQGAVATVPALPFPTFGHTGAPLCDVQLPILRAVWDEASGSAIFDFASYMLLQKGLDRNGDGTVDDFQLIGYGAAIFGLSLQFEEPGRIGASLVYKAGHVFLPLGINPPDLNWVNWVPQVIKVRWVETAPTSRYPQFLFVQQYEGVYYGDSPPHDMTVLDPVEGVATMYESDPDNHGYGLGQNLLVLRDGTIFLHHSGIPSGDLTLFDANFQHIFTRNGAIRAGFGGGYTGFAAELDRYIVAGSYGDSVEQEGNLISFIDRARLDDPRYRRACPGSLTLRRQTTSVYAVLRLPVWEGPGPGSVVPLYDGGSGLKPTNFLEVLYDYCPRTIPEPCQETHCTNGVSWSTGDCAPYPADPWSADLSDFGDCCVDDADLLAVLFNFGNEYNYTTQFKPGAGDVNCDEIVDDTDLLIVLFNFGEGCGG
jgi:hypothetical protein